MEATEPQKYTIFSRVEDLTKLGLPILGIIYVFGFVVEALHLAKYGLSPLNIVSFQYLLAGIWLLIPFIVLSALAATFASYLQVEYAYSQYINYVKIKGANAHLDIEAMNLDREAMNLAKKVPQSFWGRVWFHGSKIWLAFYPLIGFIVISALVLSWVIMQFPQSFGSSLNYIDLLKAMGIIIGFGAAIGFSGVMAWHFLGEGTSKGFSLYFVLKGLTYVNLLLIFILGYVGFFAFALYGKIPAAFGGGAPVRVQLMLKKDSNSQNVAEAIKATNGNMLSEPHFLLFTTDRAYVVIDQNNPGQAIEISRDLIGSITFNVK